MIRHIIPLCLFLAVVPSHAEPGGPAAVQREVVPDSAGSSSAAWVWKSASPGETEKVFFRREFQLPPEVASASITILCDNWHHLYVNGVDVGKAGEWSTPHNYDVLAHLKPGEKNVIAVEGKNEGGAAGMALRFRVTLKDGKKLNVVTDGSWQCCGEPTDGWQNLDFPAASTWPKVVVVAKMGDAPWGALMPPEAE